MKVSAFMASEPWQLRAQHGDLPLSFLKLAAVFLHASILVGLILSLLLFNLICESVCLEPVIIYASMSEILGKFFEWVIFIPYQHKCLQLCQCCSWLNKLYNLGRSDPELTWLSWFSIFHKWKSWYATETDLCFNDSSLVQEIDNPEHILWEKFAKILKRWITSTLSKEITCFAVGSKSAFDLWNILKEKLAKASKGREFHLHGELQSNKRDTASSWWVSSQAQNRCRWTRSHRKSFVWGQAKFLAS